MSGSLVQDLRYLIAAHSLKGVHEALQELMAEEYAFLSSVFQKGAPPPAVAEENTILESEAVAPAPPPLNQKKLKITVKKAVEAPAPVAAPVPAPVAAPVPAPAPVPANEEEDGEPVQGYTGPVYTPQEKKKFQKDAEAKKHAELTAQGATLSSILTKENLKKWIEDEGHTYSWVAREKAGCPVAQVTAISKSFGIESKITKKQAMIMIRN